MKEEISFSFKIGVTRIAKICTILTFLSTHAKLKRLASLETPNKKIEICSTTRHHLETILLGLEMIFMVPHIRVYRFLLKKGFKGIYLFFMLPTL